jgi:hypothetical protein
MSASGLAKYLQPMLAHGWDAELYNKIGSDNCFRFTKSEAGKMKCSFSSPKILYKTLYELSSKWALRFVNLAGRTPFIVDPAMYLALDALVTSTGDISEGTRYFNPATATSFGGVGDVLGRLLYNQLSIRRFRELAFAHLLPDLPMPNSQDLVASHGGYIVGMEVLWNVSTQNRKAISIRYGPGHIDKDGTPISRIREANFSALPNFSATATVELFDEGKYTPITSPVRTAMLFEIRTSIKGDQLILKHYSREVRSSQFVIRTKSNEPDAKQKASWTSAMDVVALATHFSRRNSFTVNQEQSIAQRLARQELNIAWYPGIPLDKMESGAGALVATSGDEMSRFFSASWGYDEFVSSRNSSGFAFATTLHY